MTELQIYLLIVPWVVVVIRGGGALLWASRLK
jgi:hypothetical protein